MGANILARFLFSLFRSATRHYTGLSKNIVELGAVTLVLPRWEAVHATGGGRRSAELRDEYYGGGFPKSKAADWVGSTIGKFNP